MASNAPPAPELKAIAAMASNRVIGRDGALPWHLPDDLKWFKKLTTGQTVLMGRSTWESLPRRPLPNRRNLILSRTLANGDGSDLAGAEVLADIDDLARLAPGETVWVIGGAQVYAALLPACSEVYLTYLPEPYEGDVFLPPFESGFELAETVASFPEFEIRRYVRR